MTYACLWCNKRFVRGAGAQDSIDFFIYEERSDPVVENEIRKMKFAPPKEIIIDIKRNMVIPPVLHFKIKIGNALFDRLVGKRFF